MKPVHLRFSEWCQTHPKELSECQEAACDPDGPGLTPEEFAKTLKDYYNWFLCGNGRTRGKNYGKGRYGFKPFILRNLQRRERGNGRRIAGESTRESGQYEW